MLRLSSLLVLFIALAPKESIKEFPFREFPICPLLLSVRTPQVVLWCGELANSIWLARVQYAVLTSPNKDEMHMLLCHPNLLIEDSWTEILEISSNIHSFLRPFSVETFLLLGSLHSLTLKESILEFPVGEFPSYPLLLSVLFLSALPLKSPDRG